jgi:hypothetical protein
MRLIMVKKLFLLFSLTFFSCAPAAENQFPATTQSVAELKAQLKKLHDEQRKQQQARFEETRRQLLADEQAGKLSAFSAFMLNFERAISESLANTRAIKDKKISPETFYNADSNIWQKLQTNSTLLLAYVAQAPKKILESYRESIERRRSQKKESSTHQEAPSVETTSPTETETDQTAKPKSTAEQTDKTSKDSKTTQKPNLPSLAKKGFWWRYTNQIKQVSLGDNFGDYGYNGFTHQMGTYNDELCTQEESIDPEGYFKDRSPESLKEYVKPAEKIIIDHLFKPIYSKGGVQSTYWSREMSSWFNLPEEDLNATTFLKHSLLVHLVTAVITSYRSFFPNHYKKTSFYKQLPANEEKRCLEEVKAITLAPLTASIIQYVASHCAMAGGPIAGIKSALWDNPYIYYAARNIIIAYLVVKGLRKVSLPSLKMPTIFSQSRLGQTLSTSLYISDANIAQLKKVILSPFIGFFTLLITVNNIMEYEKELNTQITRELAENPQALGPKIGSSVPREMQGHQYLMIRNITGERKEGQYFQFSAYGFIIQILTLTGLNIGKEFTKELDEKKIWANVGLLAGSSLINTLKAAYTRLLEKNNRPNMYIKLSDLAYLSPTTRARLLSAARTEKLYTIIMHSLFTSHSLANLIEITKEAPTAYHTLQELFKPENSTTNSSLKTLVKLQYGVTEPSDPTPLLKALKNAEQHLNNSATVTPVLSQDDQKAYIAHYLHCKATNGSLMPTQHVTSGPISESKLQQLASLCRELTNTTTAATAVRIAEINQEISNL